MIPTDKIERIAGGGVPEDIQPGELIILSVHKGDTKLSFDGKDPEEVAHAKVVLEDMLKRGYLIFIDTGEGEGENRLRRVMAFDPEKSEYIIRADKRSKAYRDAAAGEKPTEERVPAAKARATAIAPTSGG